MKATGMRRFGAWSCWVMLALLVGTGCRDKTPYPRLVPPPGGAESTSVTPTVVADPGVVPTASLEPVRPWLLVVTPEGSLLVSSRPGGGDLAVRRTGAIVRVTDGGAVLGLRAVSRDIQGSRSARSSNVAMLQPIGQTGPELPAGSVAIEDVTAVFQADPDMASEFHHKETLTALGVRGRTATWLAGLSGYLGGAHPYASRTLMVVDLETGRLTTVAGFVGRDLAAEVLGDRLVEACVRRVVGVAPVEGLGGVPAWLVGLGHEFESCAGEFLVAQIDPPSGEVVNQAPSRDGVFAAGVLALGGLSVPGVVDYRLSRDTDAAVLLMGRDLRDEAPLPWSVGRIGRDRFVTRELRAWQQGMAEPVVIGRGSALLTAQFLADHPASERIVAAFDAL